MKSKKSIYKISGILVILVFILGFVLVGCTAQIKTAGQTTTSQTETTTAAETSAAETTAPETTSAEAPRTPETIVEIMEVPSVEYPNLTIENTSSNFTDEELREGFEKYYTYFHYFLGAPNDYERGLTWVWDDSLQSWADMTAKGIDNFVSKTNTVYLGPVSCPGDVTEEREMERLIYGYMHETAHMFFQYNKVPVSYDFGQWIWEGEALLAESLTRRALGDPGASNEINYDVHSLLGTMINGVKQDGYKFNRSISDSNDAIALTLMADILSSDGTYDFPSKVNALKVKAAQAKGSPQLTKEEYCEIIDEAAGGKTIDGLSASEWLFSQPVSDIRVPLGSYLGITPAHVVENGPQINGVNNIRITIYGFERVASSNVNAADNYEVGFENVPVKASLYDSSSNLIKDMETNIESGGVLETDFEQLNDIEFDTGIYRMTAEAAYKNKTLTATSFNVFVGDEVSMSNDNMYFILLNEDGTEINTNMEGKITVEGAKSVNIDYIEKGLLIVTADRGDSVTVKYGDISAVYSKPVSSRGIPVKISMQ